MAKGRTGDRAGINTPARSAFQRRNREQFLFFFVGRSTSGMLFRAAQKVQVSKNHRWRNLKRTAPRGHCRERATHQSNYDNSECKIREHPFEIVVIGLMSGSFSTMTAWRSSLQVAPAMVLAYLYFLGRSKKQAGSRAANEEEEELLAVSSLER